MTLLNVLTFSCGLTLFSPSQSSNCVFLNFSQVMVQQWWTSFSTHTRTSFSLERKMVGFWQAHWGQIIRQEVCKIRRESFDRFQDPEDPESFVRIEKTLELSREFFDREYTRLDAVCINMNGTEMAAAMGGYIVTYLSPFSGKYFIYDAIVCLAQICLQMALEAAFKFSRPPHATQFSMGSFLDTTPFASISSRTTSWYCHSSMVLCKSTRRQSFDNSSANPNHQYRPLLERSQLTDRTYRLPSRCPCHIAACAHLYSSLLTMLS